MNKVILSLEDITVSFDGFKAIQGVSSKIEQGELRFFIGPNGAGKTTLLDVICGKVKPVTGRVVFKQKEDVLKKKEHEIVEMGIGRKFQVPSVFASLTVFENMELSIKNSRTLLSSIFSPLTSMQRQKIDETLETMGLINKKQSTARTLSHGEKQWLEIGMLLLQEPDLLLLDEPVAGMGKAETEKTGNLLKDIARFCSVIVVEHDMEFVRNFASRVTVLHEGRILCEGTMDQIRKDQRVIDVYLGRGEKSA
ncbi:MAG: urea ABC transporter ATP-binding protein UrtD [Bacillota bacterium]